MGGICGICRSEVGKYDIKVTCPLCDQPYHLDHLQGWIDEEETCPSCRQELPLPLVKAINKNNPYLKDSKPSIKLVGSSQWATSERVRRRQDFLRESAEKRRNQVRSEKLEQSFSNWLNGLAVVFILVVFIFSIS